MSYVYTPPNALTYGTPRSDAGIYVGGKKWTRPETPLSVPAQPARNYAGPNGERYVEMPLRSGRMAYAMSERRPTATRPGSLIPQSPQAPQAASALTQPTATSLVNQATNTPQALLNSLLGMATNTGRRSAISEAAMGAKSASDTAYGAMMRNMSRMGVRPGSPRMAGSMRKWAADRMAIEATARNNAGALARRDQFANQFSLYGAMQNDQNRRIEALARKAEMDAYNEALNNVTSSDIPASPPRSEPLQTRGLLNSWRM